MARRFANREAVDLRTSDAAVSLTPRAIAALAAGFGGLAFEMVVVRRFGLLLGTTAEAAAMVVGVFLVGLGVGGAIASRLRRPRGAAGAAVGYLAVALAILALDPMLAAVGPLGLGAGMPLVLVAVGGPAVMMGVAFPLLFDGVRDARGPGLLVGINLLGSVSAAWFAGNVLIAEIGMGRTQQVAAGSYLVAAVACGLARRARDRGAASAVSVTVPDLGPHRWLAFGSGALVVGVEILLFRRLPFFLEGFQPTLAGVLASCLLALSLGAFAGPVLARRGITSGRAAAVALTLAAVGACAGLHEWLAPGIARLPVAGDLGMHARIAAAAFVSCAACLIPAGAVVPLSIGGFEPAARGRAAGALFLAQGIGALVGAVAVGQVLPAVFSASFFAVAAPACALLALLTVGRAYPAATWLGVAAVVLASGLGVAGAGTPFAPAPPVRGSRFDRADAYRPIAHRTDAVTTASVVYDRAHHSMVLFTDEFRAAYTGPGTSYMKVLGHLPFLLRDGLRDVAVIALGTGTTADAVRAWPTPRSIHVVEISSAVLSLVDRFAGDGPVPTGRPAPFRADPRTEVHVTDGRRWLAARAEHSLDLVTMEPLLPYAPGTAALYSAEFYRLIASRLRADGLCVQWVPTHGMPRPMFETLLATFADTFPATSVWLIEQSTLLVGSNGASHLPTTAELRSRLAGAPELAARTLHEAGIADVDDLLAGFVGTAPGAVFASAERLRDDRPFLERIGYWSGAVRLSFLPDNLDALAAVTAATVAGAFGGEVWRERRLERLAGLAARAGSILDPSGAARRDAYTRATRLRGDVPRSVLLHGEETLALRAVVLDAVRGLPPASAAARARSQVDRDPACAELLALSGADRSVQDAAARAAMSAAIAVDPTAPLRAPWAFAWAGDAVPAATRSPLEDVSELPAQRALLELGSREDARGFAVRAAFGVRVARAAVAVARSRALSEVERGALRVVADPATLDLYAAAVAARGGDLLAEVDPVWRRDLPLPDVLARLAASPDADVRRRLGAALGDRRGRFAVAALADLVTDPDREVRFAAAAAVFRSFGESMMFDPDGPESDWRRTADRLRALHNRRP